MCCETYRSSPVSLTFNESHQEKINFILYQSAHRPLILGLSWLINHDPHMDWTTGSVLDWGDNYVSDELSAGGGSWDRRHLGSPLPSPILLGEVFRKSQASSLPPNQSYVCAINLLRGATIPKGRLYSLSTFEHKVMEEYITSSLHSCIIHKPGSFLLEKKDKSLCPCLDYTKLNDITKFSTSPLLKRFYGDYWLTNYMLRLKSVSSTEPQSLS